MWIHRATYMHIYIYIYLYYLQDLRLVYNMIVTCNLCKGWTTMGDATKTPPAPKLTTPAAPSPTRWPFCPPSARWPALFLAAMSSPCLSAPAAGLAWRPSHGYSKASMVDGRCVDKFRGAEQCTQFGRMPHPTPAVLSLSDSF